MAEWVEKGSIKGPPGEIPDVSDFLRDGDVSSAISGSAEKVASDKAVKDYVDAQVSAEATSRQEQDSSLQTQIGGKANVEHSHEMDDVTGLNDKISEIETNVSGKANATHTHTTAQVDGLDTKLSGIDDDIAAKADKVHKHAIADVTDLQTTLDGKAASVHTHEIANVNGLQGALDSKADASHEHSADNITSGTMSIDRIPNIPDAKIDGMSATKLTGTVPQANLPSYVDDVIEAENYASLPPTGEAGKIYVDKETNKTYRWGGSAYVEISASLALGETSATAFRGDYGKVAYDHAQAKGSEFAAGLYKITTNAEGHVTSATAVAKSDITALGIPSEDTDTTYTAGAGLGLSGTEFSIADSGVTTAKLADDSVTADKIADGVITTYDVATTSENGLMSSEDKKSLDDLTANAIKTDSSGFVQKSPIKFRGYEDGIELDITSKTETSFDLDMRSADGTSLVTITGDELFGAKTSAITMSGDATFTMNDKDIKGITDVVGSSADGTKLATDKAVKDAIAAIEIPDPLPAGGTDGQVLTKTADGEAWEDIPDYENATTEYDGLMSSADKKKLDGIENNANNYTHPASAAGAKASGLYKVQTDANGHVIGAVNVVKGDITALGVPAQDTTYVDATGSASGLMSASDKTKLDGLDTALAGKSDVGHTHEIANINGLQTALDGKAASGHKHDASDITTGTMSVDRLPSITDDKISSVSAEKITGTIPSENLPSYVDDVIEVENYAALPPTGESGKIYVDKQTNKTYRWGGSEYVEISASLALGETSATAFRGDYGQTAYQHAQSKGSEFASGLYKIATNAEGHVTAATSVVKGDITALGIPAQDTTYVDATTGASGLMSAADKTKLDGIAEEADKLPDGGTEGQVLTKTSGGEAWQDAPDGLPSGGSQRDVLAKTASGEEWSGGYPWVSDMDGNDWTLRGYFSGAERNVPHLTVKANGTSSSKIDLDATLQKLSISGSSPQVDVRTTLGEYVTIKATQDDTAEIATNGKLTIGSKTVTSITDDASTGSVDALATAKAVKDYVDSKDIPHASDTQYGLVKCASDEDFKAFMGIS